MRLRALTLSARAVREGTRNRSLYLLRGLLIAILILAVWVAHESSGRGMSAAGINLLYFVVWSDFVLISLLGVSIFATSITEEKELMTLGLLRLAGFTPVSILLGKSIGILLNGLLLLVVQVPFCLLAVTLGGVTTGQILAVFTLLLAYTLFVYALALVCSVVCSRNSRAASLAGTLLVSYHIVPGIGLGLIYSSYNGPPPSGSTWAKVASFLTSCWETTACAGLVAATGIRGGFGTAMFGAPTLVNLVLAGGLFALAWLLFERCNRNEVVSAPERTDLLPWRRAAQRPSARTWENPLIWKDFRLVSGGVLTLVIKALVYGALLAFLGIVFGDRPSRVVGERLLGFMTFFLIFEMGVLAARLYQGEVKEKTLAGLLTLPQSLASITLSKLAGGALALLPALAFLLLGALMAPAAMADACEELFTEVVGWFFLAEIVFGLHLTTWFSLRFHRGALALAFVTVMAMNMFLFMFAAIGGGRGDFGEGLAAFAAIALFVACWPLQRVIGLRLRRLAAE